MQDNNKDKQPRRKRSLLVDVIFILVFVLLTIGIILMVRNLFQPDPTVLDYNKFKAIADSGKITEEVTATPVGRCVIRIAVSVLLTFCPPAPLDL